MAEDGSDTRTRVMSYIHGIFTMGEAVTCKEANDNPQLKVESRTLSRRRCIGALSIVKY